MDSVTIFVVSIKCVTINNNFDNINFLSKYNIHYFYKIIHSQLVVKQILKECKRSLLYQEYVTLLLYKISTYFQEINSFIYYIEI